MVAEGALLRTLVGILWAGMGSAAAGTGFVGPHVDPERAAGAVNRAGIGRVELRPIRELSDHLGVERIVPSEPGCSRWVAHEGWSGRVDAARAQLQILELEPALSAFSALELERDCVDRVMVPQQTFEFLLSLAEVHFLWSRAQSQTELSAFHAQEARFALERAVAAVPRGVVPHAVAPEVRAGLAEIQARMRPLGGVPVIVLGPRAVALRWDGEPMPSDPVETRPGEHLIQLVDGDRVVAAHRWTVHRRRPLVVWAGAGDAPLTIETLRGELDVLAGTGQAPAALVAAMRVLEAAETAVLVTQTGEQIRVWTVDGARIRLRFADPPEVALRTVAGAGNERDLSIDIGVSGASALGTQTGGLALGARWGVATPVVLTFAVNLWADPLIPADEAWPARGLLPTWAGVRARTRDGGLDGGVVGGVMVPLSGMDGRVTPLIAALGSVAVPQLSRVGMRLELMGGWLRPSAFGGASVLLELR